MSLDIDLATVRLEICDDGEGLKIPEVTTEGLGLRTMRYRASLLGARFQVRPSQPAGTCIVCECPQIP